MLLIIFVSGGEGRERTCLLGEPLTSGAGGSEEGALDWRLRLESSLDWRLS